MYIKDDTAVIIEYAATFRWAPEPFIYPEMAWKLIQDKTGCLCEIPTHQGAIQLSES